MASYGSLYFCGIICNVFFFIPGMLFVVALTQANHAPRFLAKLGHLLSSESDQPCLPTSWLTSCWVTQLAGVLACPSGQLGLGATSAEGGAIFLAPAWARLGGAILGNS